MPALIVHNRAAGEIKRAHPEKKTAGTPHPVAKPAHR